MSAVWKLRLVRWIYVAFLVQASVGTALGGLHHAHENTHGSHLLALALIEIVAALAFLIERVERYAATALIAVFAIATVLSIASGEWPLRFFYYAATALFIAASAGRSPAPACATS